MTNSDNGGIMKEQANKKTIKSAKTFKVQNNIGANLKPKAFDINEYKDKMIKDHKYYSKDEVLASMNPLGSESNLFIEQQLNKKGFDKLPQKLNETDFNNLSNSEYIKVKRGIKDYNGILAEELKDDFINGKLFAGRGNFGSGTYTAVDEEIARHYGDTILDIAIPKNANIINYKELVKLKNENLTKIDNILYSDEFRTKYGNTFKMVVEKSLKDCSTYAINMNYDVIQVDVDIYKQTLNVATDTKKLHPYYIVLNRSKVIVKE